MKLIEHTIAHPEHDVIYEEKGWQGWDINVRGGVIELVNSQQFYPDDDTTAVYCEDCDERLTDWTIG